MKVRYLMPVVIFLAMVVFLYIGLGRDPKYVPSPLIGKPAPAFELPLLYQLEKNLTHEYFKGKVSLVNVWASWCVSCRQEHGLLMEMARNLEFPIIGINYKDEHADAMKYLRERGDPYAAIVFDYEGRASIDWGVYGTPETFIVDKRGIIRYKHVGPITVEKLERDLLPLMQELQANSGQKAAQ